MKWNNTLRRIDEFPDYLISNSGQVFDINGNEIKTQNKASNGYLRVRLRNTEYGYSEDVYIHRLVAEYFIPNPNNKAQVNHIDGNKLNNHVSNLEWVTPSENIKHAYDNGLRTFTKPIKRKVLCVETEMIFDSVADAARFNNVTQPAISKALTHPNCTSNCCHFRYVEEDCE